MAITIVSPPDDLTASFRQQAAHAKIHRIHVLPNAQAAHAKIHRIHVLQKNKEQGFGNGLKAGVQVWQKKINKLRL